MKEYIKPLAVLPCRDKYGNVIGESLPTDYEVMQKINELVEYLNDAISVGLLPIPAGYKEDKK